MITLVSCRSGIFLVLAVYRFSFVAILLPPATLLRLIK